jgi:hypothetical protein
MRNGVLTRPADGLPQERRLLEFKLLKTDETAVKVFLAIYYVFALGCGLASGASDVRSLIRDPFPTSPFFSGTYSKVLADRVMTTRVCTYAWNENGGRENVRKMASASAHSGVGICPSPDSVAESS